MTSGFMCLFSCGSPCFRSILRQNKSLFCLVTRDMSRRSIQTFSSKYNLNKYEEMRNRFEALPCLDLLNKEVDRFKHDLCFEDDERLEDLGKWNSKVFDYNSRFTELLPAETFLKAFLAYGFEIDDTIWNHWDSDRWRSAAIMAWCIETISLHNAIFDDVLDQSVKRGQDTCWYKKPGIGLSAVFDASTLQWSILKVIRKHFGKSECYQNLLHEFYETNRRMAYGQSLYTYNEANLKSRYEKFTFEMYKAYVENKTTQFFYFFPVHLAMILSGRYLEKESDIIKMIFWKLGMILQIQDDSLDLTTQTEVTELKGKDIRNGKITWFAIKFLEGATDSMLTKFSKSYGVDEDGAVESILELYDKTNMIKRLKEFKEQLCEEISTLIESTDGLQRALFSDLFLKAQARKENNCRK